MKILILFLSLVLLMGSLSSITTPGETTTSTEEYRDGIIILRFAEQYMPSSEDVSCLDVKFGYSKLDSIVNYHHGVSIRKLLPTYNQALTQAGKSLERTFILYYEDETDPQDMVDKFSMLPYFDRVNVDKVMCFVYFGTKRAVPQDNVYDNYRGDGIGQWNLDYSRDSVDIDAPEAWAIEKGQDDIIITIWDSGTMLDTSSATWKLHSDFNYYYSSEDNTPAEEISWTDYDTTDAGDADSLTTGLIGLDNVIGVNYRDGYREKDERKKSFWQNTPLNWLQSEGIIDMYLDHGISVGAIAAAKASFTSSTSNIAGVANGCKTYYIAQKLSSVSTTELCYQMANAVDFADVINMSWGLCSANPSQTFLESLEWAAQEKDVVLVAAVGNHSSIYWQCPVGTDTLHVTYPAKHDDVIGVANMDSLLELYDNSCFGINVGDVSVVAPVGDGIPTNTHTQCDPNDNNEHPCNISEIDTIFGGTSAASPQVAGLAALIRSRFPTLDQEQVRDRIEGTAEFYWATAESCSLEFGHGKINAYRALTEWGEISESITWDPDDTSDNTFYVSGDLTIVEGCTLTINEGTLIKIAPDHEEKGVDTSRVEIIVKGSLQTNGSRSNPIIIESFTDSDATNEDWVGICFDSTSQNNILNGIIIKHAEVGIETPIPMTLTDCEIDSCATTIITTADITFNNTTIHLDYDLTFADSIDVTLGAGTMFLIDTLDVLCKFEGSLDVNGTSSQPVIFKSSTDSSGSQKTEWDGVYFDTSSQELIINYCTIKNAEVGIENHSLDSLVISNSQIEECESGVITYGGTLIRNTTITDVTDFGVYVAKGNTSLDTVEISYSDLYGLYVFPNNSQDFSSAYIDSCVIHHNETSGIFCMSTLADHSTVTLNNGECYENEVAGVAVGVNGSVTVEDCRLHHNTYGYINVYNDGLNLEDCVVDWNTTGIFCNGADVTIEGDTLRYNTVGVYAYSADPLIKNSNVFNNNDEAIKCDNYSDAVVESTTVTYNEVGIVALSGSNPDVGHVTGGNSEGYNIIHHNSPYHIENQDTNVTVMAENNMWRDAMGPNFDLFYGNVDFWPWLTSPPDLSSLEDSDSTDIDKDETKRFPVRYDLSSGYPNPFNPTVHLKFQIPPPGGLVKIAIYDVGGRLIRIVFDERRGPGEYKVLWNGRDNNGHLTASGVYFVRMTAGSFDQTRKIVLIK